MTKKIFIGALVLTLTGCAGMQGSGGVKNYYTQSRNLSEAEEMLEKGDTSAAAKLLSTICDSQAVPGVTDEALFRLALLSLKPASEKDSSRAHQLLSRLQKDFPASQWSVQSEPLMELLGGTEELRRQNRSCKNLNQTLSKENKELLQNIEKLKQLDLELEKKNR